MPFFVYLLECQDRSLYCGWSNDWQKRLAAHQAGKASKYTRARLPVRLVYVEEVKSRSIALSRECEIKRFSARKKRLLIREKTRV